MLYKGRKISFCFQNKDEAQFEHDHNITYRGKVCIREAMRRISEENNNYS